MVEQDKYNPINYDNEHVEFNIRAFHTVLDKVNRNAGKVQARLDNTMKETSDALLSMGKPDPSFDLDENTRKEAMVTNASKIVEKEGKLVEDTVRLVGAICEFAKEVYIGLAQKWIQEDLDTRQLDKIPMACKRLGIHEEYLSLGVPQSTLATNRFTALSTSSKSTSSYVIRNCCELVKGACELGTNAVTKKKWEKEWSKACPKYMSEKYYPDGILGHIYCILWACDKEPRTDYAKKFRKKYEEDTDTYREKADKLWGDAEELIGKMYDPKHEPGISDAETAINYLKCAFWLLGEFSAVVLDATEYIKKGLPPP